MVRLFLFLEVHVSPVTFRSHGEVHPDGGAALLQNQLIEVELLPVGDVQQDAGIAYGLFLTHAVDIHRAPRQMVRVGCTSAFLIHLRRAIARVDLDAPHILRGLVILAWLQAIQLTQL